MIKRERVKGRRFAIRRELLERFGERDREKGERERKRDWDKERERQ